MSARELLALSAVEMLDRIDSGAADSAELVREQARFAREIDAELGSYISFADADAPAAPAFVPQLDGPRQLSSLPFAAKDIFCTAGVQSTAGSRILQGYIPPYDATAVALLKARGNTLLGKTAMDEFAMGSSGETCAYGPTRNPWDRAYVPGGSSSGSAAAVAACQTPLALGTDTGGSVRQPASFCGVVGYRPTYGMLSRYGLIAYSSSCDQAGVFARSTADVALALNTLAVRDPLDSTSRPPADVDYFAEAQRPVHWEKLRVGVLKPFMDAERIDHRVLDCFNAALKRMTDAGAEVVELDFPLVDLSLPAYYIITAAECSSNLARYDGVRYGLEPAGDELLRRYIDVRSRGLGSEVKRRILLGTYVLSAGYAGKYYDNAWALRRDIAASVVTMFERVDVIATPTSPGLPFRFGERSADPVRMYLADLCTVFVNLSGCAGISLPCGHAADEQHVKLPVGLQLVSAPFHDSLLLRIATQYERLTEWKYQPPEWISERLKTE